jgi:hypothetical protein
VTYEIERRVHRGSICQPMIKVILGLFACGLPKVARYRLFLADLPVIQYRHNPYATHNIAEGCGKQPMQVRSG